MTRRATTGLLAVLIAAMSSGCSRIAESSSVQSGGLQDDPQLEAIFARTLIPVWGIGPDRWRLRM